MGWDTVLKERVSCNCDGDGASDVAVGQDDVCAAEAWMFRCYGFFCCGVSNGRGCSTKIGGNGGYCDGYSDGTVVAVVVIAGGEVMLVPVTMVVMWCHLLAVVFVIVFWWYFCMVFVVAWTMSDGDNVGGVGVL